MQYQGGFNELVQFIQEAVEQGSGLVLVMSWKDVSIRGRVARWQAFSGEMVAQEGNPDLGIPQITIGSQLRSLLLYWDLATLEIKSRTTLVWNKLDPKQTLHTGAWVKEPVYVEFMDKNPLSSGYQAAIFLGPHECVLY